MTSTVDFKNNMFCYSLESYPRESPSKLKVSIPEAFLTDKSITANSWDSSKDNMNIFLNATPPAISGSVTRYNYMTLPVLNGAAYDVRKGDRFICQFVNNNPAYGFILVRC